MPNDPRRISWTDFNQPGRVAILSVHNSELAGVKMVRRFRKIYPNLKLVAYPEGEAIKGNTDLTGTLAEQIRNSEVIYE